MVVSFVNKFSLKTFKLQPLDESASAMLMFYMSYIFLRGNNIDNLTNLERLDVINQAVFAFINDCFLKNSVKTNNKRSFIRSVKNNFLKKWKCILVRTDDDLIIHDNPVLLLTSGTILKSMMLPLNPRLLSIIIKGRTLKYNDEYLIKDNCSTINGMSVASAKRFIYSREKLENDDINKMNEILKKYKIERYFSEKGIHLPHTFKFDNIATFNIFTKKELPPKEKKAAVCAN
jgi:hypothetical protein